MNALVLVFVGGGLGAVSRHLVARAVMHASGVRFPWGTMVVNIAGSLAMGLLIAWLARRSVFCWRPVFWAVLPPFRRFRLMQ